MNFNDVPKALREVNQWVLWRLEEVPGRPKPSKVPYRIDKQRANVTNRDDYSSFKRAYDTYLMGGFSGLGFVFTEKDNFVGVDLDGVIKEGNISPEATEIINELESYTEYSPSRTGVHIICKGKLPEGKKRKGFIEMYENGRYFTFTGERFNALEVEERTESLQRVHKKYLCENIPIMDAMNNFTNAVENILHKARNNEKFNKLFQGNIEGYPSQSEADQALCSLLARYAEGEVIVMDKAFRASKLYRPKWDKKHSSDGRTYGQITIENTLKNLKTGGKIQEKVEEKVDFLSMAEIKPEVVQWLWPPYLPRGRLAILAADPGTGKTWFALHLVACLSKGGYYDENTMFNGMYFKAHRCMYVTAEDGLKDTIVPRLLKSGANLNNIYTIKFDGSWTIKSPAFLDIVKKEKLDLLVLDPLQAFIGGDVDMHRANEFRGMVNDLIETCESAGTTVLIIAHNNKTYNTSLLHKVLGSIDIVGSARSVLSMIQLPNSEQKAVGHIKSNLARNGDTILFHITNQGFVFNELTEKRLEDLISENDGRHNKGTPKLDMAVEFLQDFLKDGEKPKKEVVAEMYKRGITVGDKTLNTAANILGVIKKRTNTVPPETTWCISLEQ